MNIGVTGTRHGMTVLQLAAFRGLIQALIGCTSNLNTFRHGSCAGADVEAARVVRDVSMPAWIVALPGPDGDEWRRVSGVDNETLPPKTHFARNRDIVNASDVMIVCPAEMAIAERGGTAYTHNYAVKRGVPVYIVWPDGSVRRPVSPPGAAGQIGGEQ
jgi:hypothetical protein